VSVRALPATWERHADKAAQLESRGDGYQWQAKDEYEAAYAEVGSYREIAKRADKSFKHIQLVCTMVHKSQAELEGWSFAEAYARAKQKNSAAQAPADIAPAMGTYSTVVIDPPWQYANRGTRGAANDHYPTMTLDQLAELTIPAAAEAHLYLWTTNAFLRDAFELVDAWEFEYKASLVWVKPQMGMGNYFRISHELVLFAIRGALKTARRDALSWFQAERGKHSAKPDAFYELVESCSPGPYLDMFNRDGGKLFRRKGWDGWGDEA
jgi:N6-adenosine-specific RNA methylase IME4